jgi:glycosyltransferase involved in cell wall biosynthesis
MYSIRITKGLYMLSVILPVTSGRLTNLKNVLHSLELQTLPKDQFEIIVVSDGSQDDFMKLLNGFNLDWRFVYTPKFEKDKDIPPRNKGARLARYPLLVFIDSDVILDKDALLYYENDFKEFPHGAVAGMYDWLHPCRIGPAEIKGGLDSIYHIEGEHLIMDIPKSPFPQGGPTHNVCIDMRRAMFEQTDHTVRYTGTGNMNVYLGMFSGNLGFAADDFWAAGGYWDSLTAGIVDDGAFGLTFWVKSVRRDKDNSVIYENGEPIPDERFTIRLDKRIRGAHQYHDRNVEFVQRVSIAEVKIINRRFRLEEYADGRPPVLPKPLYQLTRDAQKAWGVDHWEKKWADTSDDPNVIESRE